MKFDIAVICSCILHCLLSNVRPHCCSSATKVSAPQWTIICIVSPCTKTYVEEAWFTPSLVYVQVYLPVSLALRTVMVKRLQCEWGWCLSLHGSTLTPGDETERIASASVQLSLAWPLAGEGQKKLVYHLFPSPETKLWLQPTRKLLMFGVATVLYPHGNFFFLKCLIQFKFIWTEWRAVRMFELSRGKDVPAEWRAPNLSLVGSQRNIKHFLHTICICTCKSPGGDKLRASIPVTFQKTKNATVSAPSAIVAM